MNRLFSLLILFIVSFPSWACTTFVINENGQLLFGRNLDWVSENGLIVVNQRNVEKISLVFPPNSPAKWTSKYGSITFNQFGKEFPFGGMNEKGLVVEIMKSQAQYPMIDKRPAVNELQWIQYQLDNYTTVEEVIKSDKELRISMINQELHYLIADAKGNVAVIEFLGKEMKVYTGKDLPLQILENEPYRQSYKKFEQNRTCRFNMVAKKLKKLKTIDQPNYVDYAFDVLEEVKLSGSWSIVYDIEKGKVYYKTADRKAVKFFRLRDFEYNCKAPSRVARIPNGKKGNIIGLFQPYNPEINLEIFKDGISTNRIELPVEVQTMFEVYPTTCKCK